MRDEVMMTRDDDLLEFAIRSRMRWQRDGTDWVLFYNRRRMGRVVPDSKWPGMFRSLKSAGRLSDMANLSWAKDAVLGDAIREIEWSVRHDGARDPRNPQQRGVKNPPSRSGIHLPTLPATIPADRSLDAPAGF
jgi:hypothetical protein